MPLGAWRSRWRLLKELHPKRLRQAADAPWTLRLEGDPVAVGRLALALVGPQGQTAAPTQLQVAPAAWEHRSGAAGSFRLDLRQRPMPVTDSAEKASVALDLRLLPNGPGQSEATVARAAGEILDLPAGELQRDLTPLVDAIARLEPGLPEIGLAMARRLPGLRPIWISRLIEDGARANAAYALGTGLAESAPGLGLLLAPADIFILTKNQLLLAFKVALAAGRQEGNRQLLFQLVGVLGSGLLFRQVARELVGLLPVIGILPKVAVAYAGTQVIGQVAWAWADEDRRITGPERHRLYHEALLAATAWVRRLLPRALRAPDQGSLERQTGSAA